MRNQYILFCVFFIFTWTAAQAATSVVVLDTGEQLIGEVLPQSTDETLVLHSAILGEVKLPRARVLSIQGKVARSEAVVAVEAKPPQPEPSANVGASAEPVIDEEALAIAEEWEVVDKFRNFKAPEHWSGDVRLGMNLSQGDAKWAETYARGKLEIDPQQSSNFYRFTGSYTYRETERADGSDYKSTDKYDAGFTYRRTFLDDWFVQNALAYRTDQIKGIDREAQETVGIGYHYKPSDKFDILLGGGGGVEEFVAGYEDTRAGLNPLVNIFQEATWRPLKRASVIQKFNYYWNPRASEQFNYVFSVAVRVRLTDLLGFEFSFNKSFDNDVGDGNAQDDTQWRNALVIYF